MDYSRVLLGASLPLSRSLWQCDSCGHQWPESNEKPPADFLMSASSILLMVIAPETSAGVLFSVIAAIRSESSLVAPAELAISKSLIRKNLINMRIGRPPTQKAGG
jgi:hypothetical protein